MKCIIKDTTKALQWIELFKMIKNLNSYCTISVKEEELYIQIMDDSHVCLLNINIEKWWFESYSVIGFMNMNVRTKPFPLCLFSL